LRSLIHKAKFFSIEASLGARQSLVTDISAGVVQSDFNFEYSKRGMQLKDFKARTGSSCDVWSYHAKVNFSSLIYNKQSQHIPVAQHAVSLKISIHPDELFFQSLRRYISLKVIVLPITFIHVYWRKVDLPLAHGLFVFGDALVDSFFTLFKMNNEGAAPDNGSPKVHERKRKEKKNLSCRPVCYLLKSKTFFN